MYVPMARLFKVPGYQVAPAGNDLLAYGADAAILGILWPAIRASVYLHGLVAPSALEYP